MSQYITTADVTSLVLSDFNLSGYVNAANSHLDGIAASLSMSGQVSSPVNYLVKEYLVNYTSRQACLDKVGTNAVELGATDKYILLYEVFNREVERLRMYITPEILSDTVNEPSDTARTTIFMRS
jgi:hypothetical protein